MPPPIVSEAQLLHKVVHHAVTALSGNDMQFWHCWCNYGLEYHHGYLMWLQSEPLAAWWSTYSFSHTMFIVKFCWFVVAPCSFSEEEAHCGEERHWSVAPWNAPAWNLVSNFIRFIWLPACSFADWCCCCFPHLRERFSFLPADKSLKSLEAFVKLGEKDFSHLAPRTMDDWASGVEDTISFWFWYFRSYVENQKL